MIESPSFSLHFIKHVQLKNVAESKPFIQQLRSVSQFNDAKIDPRVPWKHIDRWKLCRKRRGINFPFKVWIPFGGKGDWKRQRTKGRIKNWKCMFEIFIWSQSFFVLLAWRSAPFWLIEQTECTVLLRIQCSRWLSAENFFLTACECVSEWTNQSQCI